MRFLQGLFAFLIISAWVSAARAEVQIDIDLGAQRMQVNSSSGSYSWPVSTARAGYSTPRGSYAPTGMARMHYSRKYDNAPMPHSIFFRGGYAIHGSYATRSLGKPASHGCVRLAPANAALLFAMVKAEGAKISITGSPPRSTQYASARPRKQTRVAAAKRHYAQRYYYGETLPYPPAPRYPAASSGGPWQLFSMDDWW